MCRRRHLASQLVITTRTADGSIHAGAAVLLIAGGVLFLLARRRKVKFTA